MVSTTQGNLPGWFLCPAPAPVLSHTALHHPLIQPGHSFDSMVKHNSATKLANMKLNKKTLSILLVKQADMAWCMVSQTSQLA